MKKSGVKINVYKGKEEKKKKKDSLIDVKVKKEKFDIGSEARLEGLEKAETKMMEEKKFELSPAVKKRLKALKKKQKK